MQDGEEYVEFDNESEFVDNACPDKDSNASEITPGTEKAVKLEIRSPAASRTLPNTTPTAKTSVGGVSRSTAFIKGGKKQPSAVSETGDESFVVQVDDTMLNEIDADLLDSIHGRGELGGKGNRLRTGQSNSTSTAASKLVENTDTKDVNKTTAASKDEKDTKTLAKSTSVKPAKDEKNAQSSRSLWVSGLSSSTRATDLKTLFSKHGKVIGAKVVTNARSPGSRCYGFVTMSTVDEATKSIDSFHKTELHGRMISVERAKMEPQGAKAKVLPPTALKSPTKPAARTPAHRSDKKPAVPRKITGRSQPTKPPAVVADKDKKDLDVLSFEKIKAERERERLRRKEMYLRNEERKRQLALEREQFKQRMIEKRQREEAVKIDREKRRLRAMRDEIERERIETERMKLETERLQIEKEREAYRREQRALQSRRAVKRAAERPVTQEVWPAKRPVTERYAVADRYFKLLLVVLCSFV
uniref:RRM domain-containing protein n=2 Tax=Arion vulgaris TaxID=1028688 RepID=A0A0B7AR29_9EUPU